MSKEENLECSFCGRKKAETNLLIAGIDAHICDKCIEQATGILDEEVTDNKASGLSKDLMLKKPLEIKEFLDQYIIGQLETKKSMSVAVYNHYKRLLQEKSDEDDVEITIPNKHIVGEVLHNSKHDSLLELTVGIDYSENPLEVVAMLEDALGKLDIVSKARKPLIGIDAFADSSINIAVRLWTPTENLYSAKYEAYKEIYLTLDNANIKIPFPQRDIHLIKDLA